MVCKTYCGSEWRSKTCCYLDLEKLFSFLLHTCSRLFWGLIQARREVGCCYLFLLWDFYSTTSGKIQPRQVNRGLNDSRRQGQERRQGGGGQGMHLVVTQYIFLPCWFVSISGWRRGSSRRQSVKGVAISICSTAKPDSGEHMVCAILLNNHPFLNTSDFCVAL